MRARISSPVLRAAFFMTLGLALASAGLALTVASAAADAAPSEEVELSLEPLAQERGRALVVLRAAGVPAAGLAGFQVTLGWDPGSVTVLDPNADVVPLGAPAYTPLGDSVWCRLSARETSCSEPAWLLTATGRWTIGTLDHDAERGRLTLAYGTGGDASAATGSGALALLEVRAEALEADGLDDVGVEIVDALLLDPSSPPKRFPWVVQEFGAEAEAEP